MQKHRCLYLKAKIALSSFGDHSPLLMEGLSHKFHRWKQSAALLL